jgi:uncharacterized membrane-anchored protein
LVNFNEISKREYDELGFLYEQRYGPYKPFKEWLIVDGDINPYIRQLMDIAFENEVEKIKIDTVEKFLFNRISREESRKILSLLLRNKIISEQGKLLMSNEEYSGFTHKMLDEVKQKVKSTEQEREVKESKKLDSGLLTSCMLLLVSSMFLCAMTYKVFGFAFLIPVFVIIGACLYKYTR